MCAAVTIVRRRAWSSATVGKTTAGREHAVLEQPVENRSPRRFADDDRRDRRLREARVEAEARELRLEPLRVRPQPLVQLRLVLQHPDRLAARRDDGGRMGRREEERPCALDEDVAQRLAAGDVAARATPTAFDSVPTWIATRPCEPEVVTEPRPLSPRTPEACASSTNTAAPYGLGRLDDPGQRRDVAVHREHAVGHDEDQPVRRPVRRGPVRGPRRSISRSASTSLCGKTLRGAFERRIPSMIEAWFSASRDDQVLLAGDRPG